MGFSKNTLCQELLTMCGCLLKSQRASGATDYRNLCRWEICKVPFQPLIVIAPLIVIIPLIVIVPLIVIIPLIIIVPFQPYIVIGSWTWLTTIMSVGFRKLVESLHPELATFKVNLMFLTYLETNSDLIFHKLRISAA